MGWSSGQQVFDPIAKILEPFLDEDDYTEEFEIAEDVLLNLIRVLEDQDWDTQCDSAYYDHPIIGVMLGNEFLEEEDYEEDE